MTKFSGKNNTQQFKATGGQTETGFRQKSEREVTAAMQGKPMEDKKPSSLNPRRRDATKQFSAPPHRKGF